MEKVKFNYFRYFFIMQMYVPFFVIYRIISLGTYDKVVSDYLILSLPAAYFTLLEIIFNKKRGNYLSKECFLYIHRKNEHKIYYENMEIKNIRKYFKYLHVVYIEDKETKYVLKLHLWPYDYDSLSKLSEKYFPENHEVLKAIRAYKS